MIKLLFLLFKGAKFGKFMLTGGTMLLSVFAYALIFGWWYAVGFVLLIFVHEMGHFIEARRSGLDVGAPTFIPFVGAWISLKQLPHDAQTEARIALAGPLFGSIGALACFYAGHTVDSKLLLALAYAGFMINLFNLMPVPPFDGGRIVGVLSPRIWLVGAPLMVVLYFLRPSPMLILVLILAAPSVWAVYKGTWRESMPEGYYEQPLEVKLKYGFAYLGLAVFLAMMSSQVHDALGPAIRLGAQTQQPTEP
jgi:Zn-dependent protease